MATSDLTDAERVRGTLMLMCPEPMREMFGPMVQMAIAQIPPDSLASLAHDLESARDENGEINIDKLIVVGKQFGLTDEMVEGYAASYAAMKTPTDYHAASYAATPTEPPY